MVGARTQRTRWAAGGVVAAFALASSSCSSSASPPGPTLHVTLRDFRIVVSASRVAPGAVTFDVDDRGPSTHEFVVVRTNLAPGQLPLQRDGLTVDEESPRLKDVGEIGDLDIGDSRQLVLRLQPGRYVVFCNLEGHYLGGMHEAIVVSRGGGEGDGSPS